METELFTSNKEFTISEGLISGSGVVLDCIDS